MHRSDRLAVARAAVALCRAESRPVPELERTTTLEGFEFLNRFAGQHQILGCVLRAWLRDPGSRSAPMALRERAEILVRGLRQRAVLFELEADRVRERLRRAGLEAVPLKGEALPDGLFTDPVDRHRQDLDLLVRPEVLDQARQALADLDYDPPADAARYMSEHFHLPLYHPDGYVVELHWDLQPPQASFGVDAERMRETGPDGAPCPADLTWHLIQQIAEESFDRLSRWIDLDRLLRNRDDAFDARFLDPRGIHGLGGVAALALELTAEWFDTPVPAVPDAWRGGDWARRQRARFDPAATVLWRRLRFRPTAQVSFLRSLLPDAGSRRRLREASGVSRGKMLAFHLSLWTRGFGPRAGDLPHERDHKRWRSSQPSSSDRL